MTIQHNKLDIQKKNVSRLYQTQFLKAGWWKFCLQFFTSCLNFCSWFWCYGFDRQRKSHRFDAFFESRIRNHWKTEKAKCGKNERSRNPTSQNRGRRKVNIYTWFFLLPLFSYDVNFLFSGYFYTKQLRIYCLSLDMKEKLVYCVPFAKCTSHHLLVTDFLAKSSSFFWREFTPQNSTLCSLNWFLKDRKKGSLQTTNIPTDYFLRENCYPIIFSMLVFARENCYFFVSIKSRDLLWSDFWRNFQNSFWGIFLEIEYIVRPQQVNK